MVLVRKNQDKNSDIRTILCIRGQDLALEADILKGKLVLKVVNDES